MAAASPSRPDHDRGRRKNAKNPYLSRACGNPRKILFRPVFSGTLPPRAMPAENGQKTPKPPSPQGAGDTQKKFFLRLFFSEPFPPGPMPAKKGKKTPIPPPATAKTGEKPPFSEMGPIATIFRSQDTAENGQKRLG